MNTIEFILGTKVAIIAFKLIQWFTEDKNLNSNEVAIMKYDRTRGFYSAITTISSNLKSSLIFRAEL